VKCGSNIVSRLSHPSSNIFNRYFSIYYIATPSTSYFQLATYHMPIMPSEGHDKRYERYAWLLRIKCAGRTISFHHCPQSFDLSKKAKHLLPCALSLLMITIRMQVDGCRPSLRTRIGSNYSWFDARFSHENEPDQDGPQAGDTLNSAN
jgi:hypothetical protein